MTTDRDTLVRHLAHGPAAIRTFNKWRKTQLAGSDGEVELDLSNADLGRRDLRGANLSRINLAGADLTQARLQGADLRGCNLTGANLDWSKLRGADLRAANLTQARFLRSELQGVRWEGATFDETAFTWTDEGAELPPASPVSDARRVLEHLVTNGTADEALDFALASRDAAGLSFGYLLPKVFVRTSLERPERLPELQTLVEVLYRELEVPDLRGKAALCLALLAPEDPEALERVVDALLRASKDGLDAHECFHAVGGFRRRAASAIPMLCGLVRDGDLGALDIVLATLAQIGPAAKSALPALESAIENVRASKPRNSEMRQRVEEALAVIAQSDEPRKTEHLSPRLADLTEAYADHAIPGRPELLRRRLEGWIDVSVVPELRRAFAVEPAGSELWALTSLLGWLVKNTQAAEAIELLRELLSRPKWKGDSLSAVLAAAADSHCLQLAPLMRPFLFHEEHSTYALDFVVAARDLGAVDDVARTLANLSGPGILAVDALEKLGSPRAIPFLLAFIRKRRILGRSAAHEIRDFAITALGSLGNEETAKELSRLSKARSLVGHGLAFLEALTGIGSRESFDDVLRLTEPIFDAFDSETAMRVRPPYYAMSFGYFERVEQLRDARVLRLVERLSLPPIFSTLLAAERRLLRRVYADIAFPELVPTS